jgi:cell wall-associated NlpC family hydrolase
MDASTGASVLAEVRSWLNTPYEHKGRVKGVGVDCGGLLYEVYGKILNSQLKPFPTDYAPDWTLHQGEELYLNFIDEYVKPSQTPVIGCPVLFKVGRCYGHAGIVTDRGVIHAWGRTAHGSVQEKSWAFFRRWPRRYFDMVT